jgi:hypothetical protein
VTAAEESLPQPQFQQDIVSRWDQALADSKSFRRTGIDQQNINARPRQDTGRHRAGRPATDNGYRVVGPIHRCLAARPTCPTYRPRV